MACAANFAWANRQTIMGLAEQALLESLRTSPREVGLRLDLRRLSQHRQARGAPRGRHSRAASACTAREPRARTSRAGAGRAWRYGQPVIVPGDMGSRSYLCVGTEKSLAETWGSSCHGAGRVLSRTAAKKKFGGRDLIGELKSEGITVMAEGRGTVAEEMRGAYKDVSHVVGIMEGAGISLRVARLRPIGVIKG